MLQKLVLVMPESDIVVEVYENLENLQIEEQDGEVSSFWHDGSVRGVRSELIVLNQDELPELSAGATCASATRTPAAG